MTNLISNGMFIDQQFEPWRSPNLGTPVFTEYKSNEPLQAYSLLLLPSTDITQRVRVPMEPKDFTVRFQLKARIDAKASMGQLLNVYISARSDSEYVIDNKFFTELTHDWKTCDFQGERRFPKDNFGVYMTIVNARNVDEEGVTAAPVQITDMRLFASYLE